MVGHDDRGVGAEDFRRLGHEDHAGKHDERRLGFLGGEAQEVRPPGMFRSHGSFGGVEDAVGVDFSGEAILKRLPSLRRP